MSGGSIPISPFVNTLNLPAVTVPTVNRQQPTQSEREFALGKLSEWGENYFVHSYREIMSHPVFI